MYLKGKGLETIDLTWLWLIWQCFFQGDSNKKLEERERELSDTKLLIQQHEAHIKTVAESMKALDAKKAGLERQVDELSEDCAKLKAQGKVLFVY